MSTYTALDLAITQAIQAGRHPLYAREACAEARRIAKLSGRDEMRVIDGRLQALRKAGKITADRKADAGWTVKA